MVVGVVVGRGHLKPTAKENGETILPVWVE